MDPHINPATGVWDDNYYANVGRYQSTGTTGSSDPIDSFISSYSYAFPKSVTPYSEKNPFSFDETLARQSSTAEYDPYYKEMLTDYISDVERTKGRSQQDLQSTLTQLASGKDYYLGAQRRMLDKAIRSTNEGYAGRGLFFSGAKQREIEQYQTEAQAQTGQYMNQYNYKTSQANLGTERQVQDLATGQERYTRNVNRAEQAAIEEGVLQRKDEALNQYLAGEKKYYQGASYPGMG